MRNQKYRTYAESQKWARKSGITNQADWRAAYDRGEIPKDIPKYPEKVYGPKTPFIKEKSEPKIPYIYKFSISKAKVTNNQAKEILTSYGFTKFRLVEDPLYDFEMRIRLEDHFNAIQYAKKLMKKYNDIFMEIKTEKFHKEEK